MKNTSMIVVFVTIIRKKTEIESNEWQGTERQEDRLHEKLLRKITLAEPVYPSPHPDEKNICDADIKDIMAAELSISVLWLSTTPLTKASTISPTRAQGSSSRASCTTSMRYISVNIPATRLEPPQIGRRHVPPHCALAETQENMAWFASNYAVNNLIGPKGVKYLTRADWKFL